MINGWIVQQCVSDRTKEVSRVDGEEEIVALAAAIVFVGVDAGIIVRLMAVVVVTV